MLKNMTEIMMNPPHILKMIDVFMREKSDKKYFATGDIIEGTSNIEEIDDREGPITEHY